MTVLANTVLKDVLVDDEDADLDLYRWCWGAGGYVITALYLVGTHRNLRLHRVILQRKLRRVLSKDEFCDHVDGNPFNNTRNNLRVASRQQNGWNRKSVRGSRSPYVGVWLSSRSGRWASFVKRDGIRFHIGYSDTQEEAAWMRDQWALVLHEGYARLNFEYLPVEAQS